MDKRVMREHEALIYELCGKRVEQATKEFNKPNIIAELKNAIQAKARDIYMGNGEWAECVRLEDVLNIFEEFLK